MAARRRRAPPPEEWSCPLCTLINHWRDRRCAACDQEREPLASSTDSRGSDDKPSAALSAPSSQQHHHHPQQQQQQQQPDTVAAAPAAPHALRGVFFSSAALSSGSATSWRTEPRLKVNRRKRSLPHTTTRQDVPASGTSTTSTNSSYAFHAQQQNAVEEAPSFSLLSAFGGFDALTSAAINPSSAADDSDSVQAPHRAPARVHQPVPLPPVDSHEWEHAVNAPLAAPSTATVLSDDDDVSQPCFQLLGPNTSMPLPAEASVAPPRAIAATERPEIAPPSANERTEPRLFAAHRTEEQHVPRTPAPPLPVYNLIDVSSPPTSQRAFTAPDRSRPSEAPEHTVPAPASVLQQGFVAASRVANPVDNDDVEDKLARAGLVLSDSDDDGDGMDRRKRPQRNKLRRNRIASPESVDSEDDEEKGPAPSHSTPSAATWECSICTNFNSCALSRCELCDTKRASDGEESADAVDNPRLSQFIDLANSQEDAARAGDVQPNYYGFDPRDFENPYEQVRPDSPELNDYGAGYDDYVDDISDNEAPMAAFNAPPSVRADLSEFEHFVCVEDLRNDFSCRIDYRQMFGESKRGKSYADRIQSRKRASTKRKRAVEAIVAAGGDEPLRAPTKKRGGATAAASKRGKGAAASRRAYAAAAAAGGRPRAPKKRKSTAKAPAASGSARGRRASAPSVYQGINHYDTSGVDFGDVSTMAWEGVGSAGYL